MELEKAYLAKNYEDGIYRKWEKSGAFQPRKGIFKKSFVISMPPPNATGTLHLGHAIMLALQDIMTRYHRMKGDATLWLPGTDHAAIATQNKVEKELEKKRLTRHDLGREKFLAEVKKFVADSQQTIRNQIRKMGSSCDWSRERYTFDEGLSEAVHEVFIRMYKDGLVYRGDRIVNWCPRCASTLADDEVEYKEKQTKFYYFRYGPFVIGTARPETKFLDKVIVVHPDDARYKKFIGKELMVPWIEGDVKATIVADPSVDMSFGTGAMTITPAHDFTDFEIAKRHGFDIVKIIDEKGILTEAAGSFAGKNARESREAIIEKLQEKNLVEKIDENYRHNLSICYRCGTPVEPLVSKQWFIDVNKKFRRGKSLKEMSIEAVRKKKIEILPDRFEKIYFHWMENLRDWCISRQIWWGHRIPIWYCKNGCHPIPASSKPPHCPHCKESKLEQDPDTLDTWFSSGLWTFSTLGWPKKTSDLKKFHPTSVLETGYDILFFWVARMILMTSYALNDIPFERVYLHGLVRTRTGEKMSKSKPETCIDPLDMIEKYGADALRLSMIVGSGPGNDIRLYEEKIAGYRNFVNKIWNAARFALLNVSENDLKGGTRPTPKSIADKWILHRTQHVIKEVTEHLERYEFSEAGVKIYDFTWGEYCAWYLEISKGETKNEAVLLYVLKTVLTLLHPFVPYVTEVLWEKLGASSYLIIEPWPKFQKKWLFPRETAEMQTVIDVITAIRKMRHENGVNPAKKIHATVFGSAAQIKLLEHKRDAILRLANVEQLELFAEKAGAMEKVKSALSEYLSSGVEIYIPFKGLVDVEAEKKKLQKEIDDVRKFLDELEGRLKNPRFREKAPTELVREAEEKFRDETEKLKKLEAKLRLFT